MTRACIPFAPSPMARLSALETTFSNTVIGSPSGFLYPAAALAVTDKQYADLGILAPQERGGFDEHLLRLVPSEGRHVADHRRRGGDIELAREIPQRNFREFLEVDAGGNDLDPACGDAVGDEQVIIMVTEVN